MVAAECVRADLVVRDLALEHWLSPVHFPHLMLLDTVSPQLVENEFLTTKSRTPKSIFISIPAAQATLTTCFANLETRDMSMEIPHWATTTAQDIERGVDDAIRTVERLADELVSVPDGRRSFDNTVLPLDEIGDVLTQASGRFGFLSQVSADPELRTAAHQQEERLSVFSAGIGFREDIDRALKAYATRAELEALAR